jgi:hypothetical protein
MRAVAILLLGQLSDCFSRAEVVAHNALSFYPMPTHRGSHVSGFNDVCVLEVAKTVSLWYQKSELIHHSAGFRANGQKLCSPSTLIGIDLRRSV